MGQAVRFRLHGPTGKVYMTGDLSQVSLLRREA